MKQIERLLKFRGRSQAASVAFFSHMLPLSLKKMTLAAGCGDKKKKKKLQTYT